MNIKKLRDKIFNKWQAKVICLIMALVIYFFHNILMLDKKTFVIPLNVVSQGALVSVDKVPRYVKVYVRAEPTAMISINSSNIKANLDITNYSKQGSYNVPIDVVLDEELIAIDPLEISIKPEKVSIRLEEKNIKYIPVEVAISGNIDEDYNISNMEVVPSSVKVIGPSSVLENTQKVYTKKVNVKGAKKSFTVDTKIDNINSLLYIDNNDSELKVSFAIEPKIVTKNFEKVQLTTLGLNNKYKITSELPFIDFTISGLFSNVNKYSIGKNDIFIDCSNVDTVGNVTVPVFINEVEGIKIDSKSLENVEITIEENIIEEEQIIETNEEVSEEKLENIEKQEVQENNKE